MGGMLVVRRKGLDCVCWPGSRSLLLHVLLGTPSKSKCRPLPCCLLPTCSSHQLSLLATLQVANGSGAFSDYSSSVPSTPSISQRELRIETIAASNTPTPIRKQSKRRSNIFTVSAGGWGGGGGWCVARRDRHEPRGSVLGSGGLVPNAILGLGCHREALQTLSWAR